MTNPDLPGPETEDLAQRARSDSSQFGPLFERLAPALMAWASLRLRNQPSVSFEPEDFVQEVWVRALGSFERFDPAQGSFRGWVFGIATNTLLHALRRHGLRQQKGDAAELGWTELARLPEEATRLSRRVARADTLQQAIQHLLTLPADDQTLFSLFALEELTAAEVAVIMQLSADAAAKRWQRLRQRLAKELPESWDSVE